MTARGNLYEVANPDRNERFDELARFGNVLVERIASSAAIEPTDYDQAWDEWVVLLRGSARLAIEAAELDLRAGDYLLIPARTRHRLVAASADALWLAVHAPAP